MKRVSIAIYLSIAASALAAAAVQPDEVALDACTVVATQGLFDADLEFALDLPAAAAVCTCARLP